MNYPKILKYKICKVKRWIRWLVWLIGVKVVQLLELGRVYLGGGAYPIIMFFDKDTQRQAVFKVLYLYPPLWYF